MSGIYLILVIGVWLAIGLLLRRIWRGWRARTHLPQGVVMVVGVTVALAYLGGSFWYAGGRTFYYDWQVDRLCAVDGGIKVYETVRLPAERFDKYGNVGIRDKEYSSQSDNYYFVFESEYLSRGKVKLIRSETSIVRRNDKKILGTIVRYGRGGGYLIGPWHGSSYSCPPTNRSEWNLEHAVFKKGVK